MSSVHRILFFCMGNICRSPTAESVMRAKLAAAGLDIEVDSAGTHGYHIGSPPDPRSQQHAARRGYALAALRARQPGPVDTTAMGREGSPKRANLGAARRPH